MSEFEQLLHETIDQETCLAVVLSKPAKGVVAKKISVRPLLMGAELQYQFSLQVGKQETHENFSPAVTAKKLVDLWKNSYADCHLYTITADYSARRSKQGKVHIASSQPTKTSTVATHNRSKQYLIPENSPCPFLHAIGVMTVEGKVKAAHYRKFRQINRYLELVDDMVGNLPDTRTLHVVDFGCGKSYLTFALHHLLTVIHKRDVQISGLDRNPDVITQCQRIAEELNCEGLSFQVGNITNHETTSQVDLAVSLHACDTATDDAIAKAVGWNAKVILAVPCCQHELADKIEADDLTLLLKQGILKERFAALATDALRVQALEICGYKTQVVEFIDMEHTAKNLLIRAVQRSSPVDSTSSVAQYQQLKATLGLEDIYLDQVLSLNASSSSD